MEPSTYMYQDAEVSANERKLMDFALKIKAYSWKSVKTDKEQVYNGVSFSWDESFSLMLERVLHQTMNRHIDKKKTTLTKLYIWTKIYLESTHRNICDILMHLQHRFSLNEHVNES